LGGAGKLPTGDARFSTALEPWGDWGRLPAAGRWNFYSYWHDNVVIAQSYIGPAGSEAEAAASGRQ
jgi:hypothetical protein